MSARPQPRLGNRLSRRGLWAAWLVGATVLVLAAVSTLTVERVLFRSTGAELANKARATAATIAADIASDVRRAVDLGIPLHEMVGMDDYLEDVRASARDVGTVAVFAGDIALFVSPTGDIPPRTFEAAVAPIPGGEVRVAPGIFVPNKVMRAVDVVTLAVAIFASVTAALAVRLLLWRTSDLPVMRFAMAGKAVGRGVFADHRVPAEGPMRRAIAAAARVTSVVRRSYRQALAVADEVRALDTERRYRDALDHATAPLNPFLFDRPSAPIRPVGGIGWVLVAGAFLTSRSALIATFASDRIGDEPLGSMVAGGTVAISAGAAAAGLAAGYWLAGRTPRIVPALMFVVGGVTLATQLTIRDPWPAALLEACTSFCLWAGFMALFHASGHTFRRPVAAGAVVLTLLALGPIIGALLAEAEGRRLAFATAGAVATVLGLTLTLGKRLNRSPRSHPPLSAIAVSTLLVTGAVKTTWLVLELPLVSTREEYARLAFNLAIAALLTALCIGAPGGGRKSLRLASVVAALALAAGALFPGTPFLASAACGLALGLAARGLRGLILHPLALPTFFLGGFGAAVISAAAPFLSVDQVALVAVVAVPFAAFALVKGRG